MRTLHLDTGSEMRGGQWQALHLIRGLVDHGHSARLLAPVGSPLLEAALAQRLDAAPLQFHRMLSDARRADLIHAHDAHAHTLGLFAPAPLVVARRVAFPLRHSLASRWKYTHAAHYIAVSEYVKQVLIASAVPDTEISVVYDGVPIPPRSESRDREHILALDSEDPGKGRRLVEAAAKIAGVPVRFSDHLLRDLPQAAIFLYISSLEGLGSAALLAMACGVPVIASRVGGLPEIVENGVTGILIDNDPEAIAVALVHMQEDRGLSQRLAARAQALVERRFTTEHMVCNTIAVYERILATC
ncbi:MAG: glycosyltransferase family 4 protein [Acidobacteriota bacterium]|nr:glycosyltransferase family 4 protein [Acidobacteriota bacterium]